MDRSAAESVVGCRKTAHLNNMWLKTWVSPRNGELDWSPNPSGEMVNLGVVGKEKEKKQKEWANDLNDCERQNEIFRMADG